MEGTFDNNGEVLEEDTQSQNLLTTPQLQIELPKEDNNSTDNLQANSQEDNSNIQSFSGNISAVLAEVDHVAASTTASIEVGAESSADLFNSNGQIDFHNHYFPRTMRRPF